MYFKSLNILSPNIDFWFLRDCSWKGEIDCLGKTLRIFEQIFLKKGGTDNEKLYEIICEIYTKQQRRKIEDSLKFTAGRSDAWKIKERS